MPELPEVETTRRGIAPHLEGQRVSRVIVRDRRLRWPIPEDLDVRLSGQKIVLVERRAKYLLIQAEVGDVDEAELTKMQGGIVRQLLELKGMVG